jgi:hypothetical protein
MTRKRYWPIIPLAILAWVPVALIIRFAIEVLS